MLRKMSGPTRNAEIEGWKILHSVVSHQITLHIPEDLNFHSLFELLESINKITKSKRTKWSENVTRMGDDRNIYRVVGEKTEEKKATWKA